jgi:hypothetical protein
LFDSSGALCGLFASQIEHLLREGRTLAIPLFTAVDIGNSLKPVRMLLNTAKAKAKECDCSGVQIRLAGEQSELLKRLRNVGLEPGSAVYMLIRR